MYERLSSLLPKKIVEKFREKLAYANVELEEKRFVGFLFIYTVALAAGLAINLYYFFLLPVWISFVSIFILIVVLVYLWLTIVAENKAKFVETVLPDALQLIASNIKSGITSERALFISARPEFGPLSEELKTASKKIMSGERLETALLDLPKRIHSKILERTMWLISKGITSGGHIADLLMQLSDDLRQQNSMKEEVKANISMYVLLIFFAAAFGAPVLLGITTFIVQVMNNQMADMPGLEGITAGGATTSMGASSGFISGMGEESSAVSAEFILNFTMILLLMTSFMASLTMGIINTGKETAGLKRFPLVLVISFAVFFAIRTVLTLVFSNLIA